MTPRRWYSGLLWIGVFALAVATMGWVIRIESDQALKQEAETAAHRWAASLAGAESVPARLFASPSLDAATQSVLMRLSAANGIYRFQLFDTTGALVLRSTDLGAGTLLRNDAASGAGVGSDGDAGITNDLAPALRTQLLSGVARAQMVRGSGSNGPKVIGVVDVAVVDEGKKPVGLARIFIDQSQRADAADDGLQRIVVVVSLLLAAIGALVAYRHVTGRRSHRRTEDRLRFLAAHDALSGALNRGSFIAALSEATSAGAQGKREPACALLRIDLDHFKDINDALGQGVGDDVLKATTRKLAACLGAHDRLARLEADEFAILLQGPRTREAVVPIARRLQQALAEPMELAGQHVRCNGSIGISLFGSDGRSSDELMARAELALSRAKSEGRATFVFHNAQRDGEASEQRLLTRDLRAALSRKELELHYQPLFDNDGALLVGYEALLRWNHPTQGLIPPAVFVPLAEAADLIDDIGLWVLRKACSDASRWPASLGVAVNLSANQFASGALVRQVARALAESGLAAERLCIEITESLLMNNSDQVMQTLRKLGALGVSIAMDDFGTGFSSLAYLWRFPFDKIKIDQVFTKNMVHDPKVAMIVRSIVTLAHSLEIRVNAEGVETEAQLQALQDLGCHELQGFLLGRPAPVESLTHAGHGEGRAPAPPRGEDRESLFATIAMDLPGPYATP